MATYIQLNIHIKLIIILIMYSLIDLPDDIQGILLPLLDNVSIVMLCHTNKYYHKIVSCYCQNNKIKLILNCHEIAGKRYLEILEWVNKNNHEWSSQIAQHELVEFLEWTSLNYKFRLNRNHLVLSRAGCGETSNICFRAAENGHFEVLKWARKNNYFGGPKIY
jgi:hypothetical protein